MKIADNLTSVMNKLAEAALAAGRNPEDINLVAATKTNSAVIIAEAIQAGVTICGENRIQEMMEKNALGAYKGAKLHFIGHLQRNKVSKAVGFCDLIQSVHSSELLELINRQAAKLDIIQDVLLEINIGAEETKSGLRPEELCYTLEKAAEFGSIRVRGLMAIPPISDFSGRNRAYFADMYQLFIDNSTKKYDNVSMDFLSMGMSSDFENAIAEGSNMIRVGSAIFGPRPNSPLGDRNSSFLEEIQ